ncbi:unnamed protein product [Rhizophagus irregularis]|nr:unnamed protein product [Rhizophagus irregularis]
MGTFLWFFFVGTLLYFGRNGNVTNVSYNIFVESSVYSILGKRNGFSAYLTWEKKGTFGAFDLEFGNVLSAYSILEETEWLQGVLGSGWLWVPGIEFRFARNLELVPSGKM